MTDKVTQADRDAAAEDTYAMDGKHIGPESDWHRPRP